jgi:hypothetical protein
LVVQLSLQLSDVPAPPEAAWAALTPEERLAVVAALARVMAKSIGDKEEEDEE